MHKVYDAIAQAVKAGTLREPFTPEEFRHACPGLGDGTYNAFLYKHRLDNPGGNSELFEQVGRAVFVLLRPFRYGLDR